jgi:hypothetical protein
MVERRQRLGLAFETREALGIAAEACGRRHSTNRERIAELAAKRRKKLKRERIDLFFATLTCFCGDSGVLFVHQHVDVRSFGTPAVDAFDHFLKV